MKIYKIKKRKRKVLLEFLKKNFKSKHILYKSKKLFDWQYLHKNYYNFFVLETEKIIKAAQGYIPTSRYDKNLENDTIFMSIWSSSEISKGSKLFFYLLKNLKVKLLVGLGGTNESFLFQKLLKFNCGYMKHYFLAAKKKSKKLISPKNFTNEKLFKITNNFTKMTNIKQINEIDKNVFTHQYPRKTDKYLINRYLKHPFYNYILYKITNKKKTVGIFVFRVCKFDNRFAIRIIDFLGEENNFSYGKSLFLFLLKKYDSEYIDIYSYGIREDILKKSGLENVEKYKKLKLIIPNYFEPFVKKNIKLGYAFKCSSDIKRKVRFFKGDSDLDRPNIL
ncbi:hypothetical protein [Candidatus Pelagibacter sp. HIMB1542]|uniref:hypothetical protein n=1 Tax=Candidatus Pelagibacter sp. HIMB1542 TaxID=3413346 RepID=UPI003F86AD0A